MTWPVQPRRLSATLHLARPVSIAAAIDSMCTISYPLRHARWTPTTADNSQRATGIVGSDPVSGFTGLTNTLATSQTLAG
jgi:hypothetical protein